MPVKVRCRGCQKVLNAPDKARGRVIQCPGCGTKLKVPEGDAGPIAPKGAAKKPARKKQSDSSEFLAALGVNQLESEDQESKVCPYCAADMDPEETVCRKCGMNTVTGQMDAKEAKKRARQGPDPALFYNKAWSDSWEFLSEHWRLGMRTGWIWTFFLTALLTCLFLAELWVFIPAAEAEAAGPVAPIPGEEAEGPVDPYRSVGFIFWMASAFVFWLGIPGWFWALCTKITDHTMQKEAIKEDRIQFDIFEAIALGLRVLFWPAILMMPVAPLWLFVIIMVGGGIAIVTGGQSLVWGPVVIGMAAAYFLIPYLFFPQAMAHMSVRHRFKAWILWEQIVIFVKNAPATLYWWMVWLAVNLPALGVGVCLLVWGPELFDWTFEKVKDVIIWVYAFVWDAPAEGEPLGIFFSIIMSLALPVVLAVVAAPVAFLMAFPAVFMMRVTGLYGFYRRETLDLVTHVKPNEPAGFWVRFLCRAIDLAVFDFFMYLMVFGPVFIVESGMPLGKYFAGFFFAAVNGGFVAIAGSKDKRFSIASAGMGALAGVSSMYMETIPFFGMVYVFIGTMGVPLLNYWIYFSTNEASTQRSTIGKEAFGLIVQTEKGGNELTLGQATGRHAGRMLCDILAGLPYVLCAFHPKKQALHDVMSKSVVVFRGDR